MSLFQHFSILDLIIIAFFLDFQCAPKQQYATEAAMGMGGKIKKVKVASTTTQPKLPTFLHATYTKGSRSSVTRLCPLWLFCPTSLYQMLPIILCEGEESATIEAKMYWGETLGNWCNQNGIWKPLRLRDSLVEWHQARK